MPAGPTVQVQVTARSVLSYAMAHNGLGVVDAVRLTSSVDRQGVRVLVQVRDSEGPVSRPCELVVDLTAGATTLLDSVPLHLDPAAMLQVDESRPATVVVQVGEDDEVLGRLDGLGWAQRRTVGDRDGLPVQVLGNIMRWPAVERVWLPEWLVDRNQVLARLTAAVERARSGRSSGPPHSEPQPPLPNPRQVVEETIPATSASTTPERVTVTSEAAPEDFAESDALRSLLASTAAAPAADAMSLFSGTLLPGQEPFVPWRHGVRGSREVLDALPEPWAAQQVWSALVDGLEAEGPIHLPRLARLVAASFGLSRVNAAREASILAALPPEVVDPAEPFAWANRLDRSTWTGFRADQWTRSACASSATSWWRCAACPRACARTSCSARPSPCSAADA